MKPETKKLLIFLIITRVLILVLPWLTINLLFPEKPAIPFVDFTRISWSRWDAPHYLYLAQNWYTNVGDAANFIVFFPLYPLILKPFIAILGDLALSGILVSNLLFLFGAYFFYKLINLDYGKRVAQLATIALAIFPTSYFFSAPYTESLFLLLFSLSFYFARKENWILAGIVSGFATIARPYGFLITLAIFIEWLFGKKRKLRQLPIIVFPTIVAGFYYLVLNQNTYGNAFEFQKILALHWQKRLISPFISIRDSWRIALSGGLNNFVVFVGWAEAISTTVSWILIPLVFKYLRRSWAIYYTLSVILFSSTSFILSTPRYLLSIPPLFVLIALGQKNQFFKIVWSFTSVAILFCLTILFTRGQWAF